MRSASGTKSGLAASVVAWTNLTVAALAGPAFQEGRGSPSASARSARLSAAAPPSMSAANSRRRRSISSREGFGLAERDAHPAEVDRETETNLAPMQAQHHAVGVGKLRRASAPRYGQAGADGRVEAGDVAWGVNIRGGADEIRRRDADQGARVDAADSERKSLPSEGQSPAAAGHAEDETGAGDIQGDRSCCGFGRRNEGCGRQTGA